MLMAQTIELDDPNLIIKSYRVRETGKNGTSLVTTIPREVFEREARKKGLSPQEGLEKLRAVWRYNSFEGLHLNFEPIKEE
ncbi:unnamed protein product [marine sediment metagenome]|uniref:Uncharacterized protein n=1 Tax=marine sediment metagenome TaxID=412755 RepID=X1DWD0_9ZZZZ